ncbi:hypothetical protein QM588_12550 [Rhodococcus sp. IEGM 1354]|uniref:AMIN-like domain-containing (lipo)protein n=1 Tax=Nocardiaceae TaxID=85025 RepID=UPI0024B7D22B|nr:hypothetical protein [Rhodococcus sp. IEGM 1354]MDI9931234.1 hypothetical protein [Rhodococcus sp. IEGM 1354]
MSEGYRRPVAAGSVVAPLLAAVLLVGCSAGGANRPVTDASPSPNFETAIGSLVVGDPFTAPTAPTETVPSVVPGLSLEGMRHPSGSPVAVTDVVLGTSSVEYRLAGNGPVSYTVRYVDEAVRYGTSEPVALPGRAVLQVDIAGTSTEPDATVVPYAGPDRIRNEPDSAVVAVDFLTDPDGISQSFVAVASDRPNFAVYSTDEPAAVIVTIS